MYIDYFKRLKLTSVSGDSIFEVGVSRLCRPHPIVADKNQLGVSLVVMGSGMDGALGDFWDCNLPSAAEVLGRLKGPAPKYSKYRYYERAEWCQR